MQQQTKYRLEFLKWVTILTGVGFAYLYIIRPDEINLITGIVVEFILIYSYFELTKPIKLQSLDDVGGKK